jgi:hypothetical protein
MSTRYVDDRQLQPVDLVIGQPVNGDLCDQHGFGHDPTIRAIAAPTVPIARIHPAGTATA